MVVESERPASWREILDAIPNRLLLLGHLREDEEHRVMDSVGRLSALEIYIDDTAGLSVGDMRSRARRLLS